MNGNGLCPLLSTTYYWSAGDTAGEGFAAKQCIKEKCEVWMPEYEYTDDKWLVTIPGHCGLTAKQRGKS